MNAGTRARFGAYLFLAENLNEETLTSERVAELLGVNPTQVRRDLSGLGRLLGKRGRGYSSERLRDVLRRALDGDATGSAGLVAVGLARFYPYNGGVEIPSALRETSLGRSLSAASLTLAQADRRIASGAGA